MKKTLDIDLYTKQINDRVVDIIKRIQKETRSFVDAHAKYVMKAADGNVHYEVFYYGLKSYIGYITGYDIVECKVFPGWDYDNTDHGKFDLMFTIRYDGSFISNPEQTPKLRRCSFFEEIVNVTFDEETKTCCERRTIGIFRKYDENLYQQSLERYDAEQRGVYVPIKKPVKRDPQKERELARLKAELLKCKQAIDDLEKKKNIIDTTITK